jgi:hypothetical protein
MNMTFVRGRVPLIAAVLASAAVLLVAVAAQAQTSLGLGVSPSLTERTVAPGETVVEVIKVTNDSSDAQTVDITAKTFAADGEAGQAKFADSTTDISSWVTFDQSTVTVPAREAVNVTATIAVPSNATAGGHYLAVLAGRGADEGALGDQSGIAVGQQVASLFLMNVSGEIRQTGKIVEFSADQSSYNTQEEVEFEVKIENTGNTHTAPDVVVELLKGDTVVDTINLNPNSQNVLPDSSRVFTGSSNATANMGKYTARAVVTYAGTALNAAPIQFWVMDSARVMMWVIVGVVILVLLGFAMRRRVPMAAKNR